MGPEPDDLSVKLDELVSTKTFFISYVLYLEIQYLQYKIFYTSKHVYIVTGPEPDGEAGGAGECRNSFICYISFF